MIKNKIMDDGNIKCDFCNLDAKFNLQKIWTKFEINENGRYKEDKNFRGCDIEEPVDKDNVHLCARHLDKWINDKI